MSSDALIYKLSYFENEFFKDEITKKILSLTAHGLDRHSASTYPSSFSIQHATVSMNAAATIVPQPSINHQLEKLTMKDLAYIVVHGTTNLNRVGDDEPLAMNVYLALRSLSDAFVAVGTQYEANFLEYEEEIIRDILEKNGVKIIDNSTRLPYSARLERRPELESLMNRYGRSIITLWAYGRHRSLSLPIQRCDPLWTPAHINSLSSSGGFMDRGALRPASCEADNAIIRASHVEEDTDTDCVYPFIVFVPNLACLLFSEPPTVVQPPVNQDNASFTSVNPHLIYSPPPPTVLQPDTNARPKRKQLHDETEGCETQLKRPKTANVPQEEDEDVREADYGNGIFSLLSPPAPPAPPAPTSFTAKEFTPQRSRTNESDKDYQPSKATPPPRARGSNDRSRSKAATTPVVPIVPSAESVSTPPQPPIVGEGTCWPCPYPNCTRPLPFKTKAGLNRHLETVAHKDRSHVCGRCGGAFTRSDALWRHLTKRKRRCEPPDVRSKSKQTQKVQDKEDENEEGDEDDYADEDESHLS